MFGFMLGYNLKLYSPRELNKITPNDRALTTILHST